MKMLVATLMSLLLTVAVVGGARAAAGGDFRPAAAAETRPSTLDAAFQDRSGFAPDERTASAIDDTLRSDVPTPVLTLSELTPTSPAGLGETPSAAGASEQAPSLSVTAAGPVSAALPSAPATSRPQPAAPALTAAPAAPAPAAPAAPATAALAPIATPPPPPVTAATPAPAPVVAAPAPAACAATWFCYPRLGIAGPIVPYSDCLGRTDVGDGIRSFTCISPFYLMGHAYTQFGAVTGWQAGDVVFASGRRFVISTAFVQSSCEPPAGVVAPLSLQTSLSSGGCGRVLVVQGR